MPPPPSKRHCREVGGLGFIYQAKVNNKISRQAVCWDRRHGNDGDTVDGLVAGMMASLRESAGNGKSSSR